MNKDMTFPPTAMAVGYFDGIHRGHKQVIDKAKQIADEHDYESAVMTFDPHPSVVLGKGTGEHEHITPVEDKVEIMEDLGIDRLYIITFSKEFASLTPQEFVDLFVIGFNVKHVVAGFDFSFGKKGEGTMETLPFHSRGKFDHTTVDKVAINGEKVSSTLIRTLIRTGSVERIPNYMGRRYRLRGSVVRGEQRGSTIGFPTANILPADSYLFPATGVYAVKLFVNANWYKGVCNVGYKPTFHNEMEGLPSVEVHLFCFNQSIYGEKVIVEWCQRLRDEKKFSSAEELIKQISIDSEMAMAYFENSSE
ncbi:bifunctional riboflavin kinase/FAD synthetase [Alkalihalobacillus sp. AL-G]|nr:bifunctional riboflavin kinase/FAD synthetase [Alkalihalobacillus sp. AL-G]WLD95386.1 bifunctional riboflavin kinase/FAD synthetase [Alkalihalobacillus sp. AL-G]